MHGNILIVDDKLSNLKILANILENKNYKVRKTTNGKSAIRSIKTELPDLILLDIKMPDMDGYEVCRQLKSDDETKDVIIIFISALNDVFDKVKAFESGGVDYITKPFQEEEVLARIKSQLTIQTQKKQLQQEKNLLKTKQELLLQKQAQLEQEIKQRKEAEAILFQSRSFISSILNSSGDGIAAIEAVRDENMKNIIDFSCLVVNPIISRLFDSNSDDLIGKPIIKNFLTKVSPDLFPALVNVVETGQSLEQDISINESRKSKMVSFNCC